MAVNLSLHPLSLCCQLEFTLAPAGCSEEDHKTIVPGGVYHQANKWEENFKQIWVPIIITHYHRIKCTWGVARVLLQSSHGMPAFFVEKGQE